MGEPNAEGFSTWEDKYEIKKCESNYHGYYEVSSFLLFRKSFPIYLSISEVLFCHSVLFYSYSS